MTFYLLYIIANMYYFKSKNIYNDKKYNSFVWLMIAWPSNPSHKNNMVIPVPKSSASLSASCLFRWIKAVHDHVESHTVSTENMLVKQDFPVGGKTQQR